jgi:hypothetical protein
MIRYGLWMLFEMIGRDNRARNGSRGVQGARGCAVGCGWWVSRPLVYIPAIDHTGEAAARALVSGITRYGQGGSPSGKEAASPVCPQQRTSKSGKHEEGEQEQGGEDGCTGSSRRLKIKS